MKKILSILLISFLFIGCNTGSTKEEASKEVNPPTNPNIFNEDLNNDGKEDTLKITFSFDSTDKSTNMNCGDYLITVTSNNKEYKYEEKNIIGLSENITFADFDKEDNYKDFYINNLGVSDDPSSAIFRFNGSEIVKVVDTIGQISNFDGKGKIYTQYSYTKDKNGHLLSYYNINDNNPIFVSKKNLIGKELQYDNSLILFSSQKNEGSFNSLIDNNLEKTQVNEIISNYKENEVVKVSPPNEALTIIDVDYTNNGVFPEGNPRNIILKVKTKDGKEGFLHLLNGGD